VQRESSGTAHTWPLSGTSGNCKLAELQIQAPGVLMIWFFIGAGLGWWACRLFWNSTVESAEPGAPQGARTLAQLSPTFLVSVSAGQLNLSAAPQADPSTESDGQAAAPPAAQQPLTSGGPGWAARAVFFTMLALVLLFVFAHYLGLFGVWLFAAEAFLASPRVIALASGVAAGIWVRHYRHGIARHLADFYDALLGTETKSSWALQAAVALVALFAILLVIKPDLLDHIESLRAGDIEAKFASASSTTREATRVALVPFRNRDTLEKYIDFTKEYRNPNSGRGIALALYDQSQIKEDRTEIRDIIFENYIEPFTILLSCIQRNRRIEEFRRDARLMQFAILFKNKIVDEKGSSGAALNESGWFQILERFDDEIMRARQIVERDRSTLVNCKVGENSLSLEVFLEERRLQEKWGFVRRKMHARWLADLVERAKSSLAKNDDEKEYRLSYLDPYVVGAVGDLLSFVLGDAEKANFLTVLKKGYPSDPRFAQPGLVNFYYQLADSTISREEPWPVDDQIKSLAQSLRMTEHLLARARSDAREAERRYIRSLEVDRRGIRASDRDWRNIRESKKSDYNRIIDTYLLNKFLIISKHLEIYVQGTLAGDPLTDEHRRTWINLYRDLEGLLGGVYAKLASIDAPERSPSGVELEEWTRVEASVNKSDDSALMFLEARANMALSAVMLTEKKRIAPLQACAVSRAHLSVAGSLVEQVVRELRGGAGDAADESRLRGYLQQVRARIDASCRP
jgi:hypothetical protein